MSVRRLIVEAVKVLFGEDIGGLPSGSAGHSLDLRVMTHHAGVGQSQSRSLATNNEIQAAIAELRAVWDARIAEAAKERQSQAPVQPPATGPITLSVDDDEDEEGA